MRVLVVQDNKDLGELWCGFLRRQGVEAELATDQTVALQMLAESVYDALIIEPALPEGSIPVADFATYRNPDITILAVTRSSFFSDGSIFSMLPNARGFMRTPLRPDDLAAYLDHCTARGDRPRIARRA